MKQLALILVGGLGLSCGGSSQQCPTIDEGRLVEKVTEAVLARLGAGRESDPESSEEVDDEVVDLVERVRVPVEGAPWRGASEPLVTIVEFSEFQCPFCSRVVPTLARLLEEHPDEVRIVFRHNPLAFHQDAMPAAEAAHEAFVQAGNDGFWRMHDLLFENQRSLARADLERYAQQAGLNAARFMSALDAHTHRPAIQRDMEMAVLVGARGTPSSYVNGRQVQGAQPFDVFETMVQEEIAAARLAIERGVRRPSLYQHFMRNALARASEPAREPPTAARQPDPNAVYHVPAEGFPQRGPNTALVTIVEFQDFECPFCTRVQPTLDTIVQRYGNDVRVVFRNNPLPFHQHAAHAAIAAHEAFVQRGNRGFWAMHDLLFANQRALEDPDLERYAQQVGLNMTRFRRALSNETHESFVDESIALARQLGAVGTPSFFINGHNLRGAQPLEAFTAIIDRELEEARELVRLGTPRAQVYARIIRDGAHDPQFIAGVAPAAVVPAPQPDANRIYPIALPAQPRRRGPENAPVVIQLFTDFQCPFCSRLNPTLDRLVEAYPAQVQIVFRDYPLPFHQNAFPAAEAAREVFAQRGNDGFWRYMRLLFDNQQSLERASLERYAQQVGANMPRFRRALDNATHRAAVQADMDAVTAAGAQIGTPSCFVNGRLIQGAQPFEAFRDAIDAALRP